MKTLKKSIYSINLIVFFLAVFATTVISNPAIAGNLKDVVTPFYTKCLTVNPDTNVTETMGALLEDDF